MLRLHRLTVAAAAAVSDDDNGPLLAAALAASLSFSFQLAGALGLLKMCVSYSGFE